MLALMPLSLGAQEAPIVQENLDADRVPFAAWLGQIDTLQAQYRQRIWNNATGGSSSSEGVLLVNRKTAQYRVDVALSGIVSEVILGDGEGLWHYDRDLAQATRYALEDIGDTPLMLVSSNYEEIERSYEITGYMDAYTGTGTFEFNARDPQALIPNAALRVQASLPQRLQTVDASGEVNILYFIQPVINQLVGEADFAPQWEEGVTVTTQSDFGVSQ